MSCGGDEEEGDQGGIASATKLRWKGRNHFNFVAGHTRLRAVPTVLHLLPEDIDWFGKDHSLFDELKRLLRDRVVAVTNNGDRDAEAPKSRKRARKEELCVQGERLQFTYRYRKTLPRYTVLSYVDEISETLGRESRGAATGNRSNSSGSGFRHFPLSDSTLLVWVYRFDAEDPYRPVPNEAALQFAPTSAKQASSSTGDGGNPLDFEAAGTGQGSSSGAIGDAVVNQGGQRDAGLLSWLWGWDTEGCGGNGKGGRGESVRQHFIGSAAWQGTPDAGQGPGLRGKEEDDLQLAIRLSLQESGGRRISSAGAGTGGMGVGRRESAVEILDDEDQGVEETKGSC